MKSIAKSRICKNLQALFREVFGKISVKKLKELKVFAIAKNFNSVSYGRMVEKIKKVLM
ncbi:MAG: hypothetical protein WCF93_02525 [Candidatus Moraniibacteriota bacterium]